MNKAWLHPIFIGIFFLFTTTFLHDAYAVQRNIEVTANEEITFSIYGKNSRFRILWISSSYGIHPRHQQSARLLAQQGMEVWQVDFVENLFLPKGAESIRSVPGELVARVIEKISGNGQYEVLILTSGYGSIPALRGVHTWQNLPRRKARLIGTVIFSPYLYRNVPTLGMAPTLIPVANATNTPVYIYQAEKNGNRAHIPDMLNALQQNAPVYTHLLNGVTSLFYDEDTAPQTLTALARFPALIESAITSLKKHPVPSTPVSLVVGDEASPDSGLNVELVPYKGQVQPEPVALKDANGHDFVIRDFKGKVTLINFWASWCPPCVEEIPSLNRLEEKMKGKPFQLISINYAESAKQISEFMKQVKVEFPVLLDSEGKVSAKWKVVAFPSTFVIGTDGKVHYGVNAAIHWDTDRVIQQLESLM